MANPEQDRDALIALFNETEKLVGGDWANTDDPTPLTCTTAAGADGVQFGLGRDRPGISDASLREQITKKVALLWEQNGYTTSPANDPTIDLVGVGAINEQLSSLRFGINDNAVVMSGGSNCTAGSLDDIAE